MAEATDLSAYIRLNYYDQAFAVFYGICFYSLLVLLTSGAAWPGYTVLTHVMFDFAENTMTVITLGRYLNTMEVSWLTYLMPMVSTIKWSLAAVNMFSIPLLAVW